MLRAAQAIGRQRKETTDRNIGHRTHYCAFCDLGATGKKKTKFDYLIMVGGLGLMFHGARQSATVPRQETFAPDTQLQMAATTTQLRSWMNRRPRRCASNCIMLKCNHMRSVANIQHYLLRTADHANYIDDIPSLIAAVFPRNTWMPSLRDEVLNITHSPRQHSVSSVVRRHLVSDRLWVSGSPPALRRKLLPMRASGGHLSSRRRRACRLHPALRQKLPSDIRKQRRH